MSLFEQLLRLHGGNRPVEDFFTEIVAHILRTNPAVRSAWLFSLNAGFNPEDYQDCRVRTQVLYKEGRPDMVLEFYGDDFVDLLVIESKVGATEGSGQLCSYAKALARQEGRKKTLLFVTRSYDPRDQAFRLKLQRCGVRFIQQRWRDFYVILGKFTGDPFVAETVSFMERHNMGTEQELTPSDLIAIALFDRVYDLMWDILKDDVRHRFHSEFGGSSSQRRALNGLRHKRFLVRSRMDDNWWIGVGFFMKTQPTVGVQIQVGPKHKRLREIVAAMRNVGTQEGWRPYNLDNPSAWPKIMIEVPVATLLTGNDHVSNIKRYLFECINHAVAFRDSHPELPWLRPAGEMAEEEE